MAVSSKLLPLVSSSDVVPFLFVLFVDLEVYTCTLICIKFATGSAFKCQRCDKTCQPKVFYFSENVQFHSVDNLTIY